jgi:hypothetical protein
MTHTEHLPVNVRMTKGQFERYRDLLCGTPEGFAGVERPLSKDDFIEDCFDVSAAIDDGGDFEEILDQAYGEYLNNF